jgi:hypothetical protein
VGHKTEGGNDLYRGQRESNEQTRGMNYFADKQNADSQSLQDKREPFDIFRPTSRLNSGQATISTKIENGLDSDKR